MVNRSPCGTSRVAANTLGGSNYGKQDRSIELFRPTKAAARMLPNENSLLLSSSINHLLPSAHPDFSGNANGGP